jgi:DNA-binding transcriptional MerR regulator
VIIIKPFVGCFSENYYIVPMEIKKSEKLYYSIGEVAAMFDVNTSLIRFWEKEFSVIKPHKAQSGKRMFTSGDVDNFHMIYHLVKEKGMTLNGAKQALKERRDMTEAKFEIVKSLKDIRGKLERMKSNL